MGNAPTGRQFARAAVAVAIATFARPSIQELSGAADDYAAEFVIAPQCEAIFVPLSVQDRTFTFKIDTGSTSTSFGQALRPLLGVERGLTRTKTLHGVEAYETYDAPVMGPVVLRSKGTVRLEQRSSAHLPRRDGVVGMDALCSLILDIDFSECRFRILHSLDGSPDTAVKLGSFGGVPTVEARVGGDIAANFFVDTGFFNHEIAGSLNASIFDRLLENGTIRPLRSYSLVSQAGISDSIVARVPKLTIAGHTHRDLVFIRGSMSALGLGYWSRYRVVFDFPEGKMHLRAGSDYSRRDTVDLSGLCLLKGDAGAVVDWAPDWEAEGLVVLRAGDVITAIDGDDIRELSVSQIRRRFQVESTNIRIDFSRGDRHLTTQMETYSEAEMSAFTTAYWASRQKKGRRKR